MSHFTTVKTQIKDLEILKETLKSMGYMELMENDVVRGYLGNRVKADLVVKMPNGYDIGFQKNEGVFHVVADFWGAAVKQEDFLRELTQKYAYELVKKEALLQGFRIAEEVRLEDGTIKIVAQKWV